MCVIGGFSRVPRPSAGPRRHQGSAQQDRSNCQFSNPYQCTTTSIFSRFDRLPRKVCQKSAKHYLPPQHSAASKAQVKVDMRCECAKAFQGTKDQLVFAKVLMHYDLTLPILMEADASAYGIGVIISHIFSDGSEKLISCTLTGSENNYAQIEKETLSLIFGVLKFHKYLLWQKVQIGHGPYVSRSHGHTL